MSFKPLLIYRFSLNSFLFLIIYMLKNLGHSIYTVSQSLDFANPVLIVQFSLFLCPLCFLHIGRWIQRLSQIQVQCLWQNCIYYCVLWLRGRQCLVFTLFFSCQQLLFHSAYIHEFFGGYKGIIF